MEPDAELTGTRSGRFFLAVTARPWLVVLLSLAATALAAGFVPLLVKNTSVKAYTPARGGSLEALDRLEEVFGLGEPVVVLIVNDGPEGVFNPRTLNLVASLTEEIRALPGVDLDRVTSLSAVSNVVGTEDAMVVEPFYEGAVATQEQADRIREAVFDFELYLDSLVTRDGRATAIIAELRDLDYGPDVYDQVRALSDGAPQAGEQIYVAGVGAYNSLVGDYIDADLTRLNPIAGLVIVLVLFVAHRTVRGVLVPLIAVAGALAFAVGTMAAFGVEFYGITTTLTVILIVIAVCDGIHLVAQYYREQSVRPEAGSRELSVRASMRLWRPVVITSVTSAAGFLALSTASDMRPMEMYGLFATVGIAAALVLSLLTIPAVLSLLPARPSPVFARGREGSDVFGRLMEELGRIVHDRAWMVLGISAAALVLCAVGASRVVRDQDTSAFLQDSEPLRIAQVEINRRIGGTMSLDVMVDAGAPENLYRPEVLRRIEAAQAFMSDLPHVKSTMSIVDFVKQMNRAMNADREEAYAIPDDADLIAQYFLVYSAGGNARDYEKFADYDFRFGNIRANVDSTRWSVARALVPKVQRFVDENLAGDGVQARLAGWKLIGYYLDDEVARAQSVGILYAFAAVWLMSLVCFRSVIAATLAPVPVAMALLSMYALMGFTGILLDIATSMISAIAIGLTIDFSVHTLDRLIVLVRRRNLPLNEAFPLLFQSTGRALFFNFAAVLLGFGVLVTSYVPSLQDFGVLIAACILAGFVGSVTFLPALVKVTLPEFARAPRLDLRTPVVETKVK